jgi:predicted short-subunit dehydrogenase-like oxidoreductase (DUF2520 family)
MLMVQAPPLANERLGIIGSGRVAQAMMLALAPHVTTPPLIWGRTPAAMANAIARVKTGVEATSLADLAAQSSIILIAVSDDAIPAIVDALAAQNYPHAPLITHVSGGSGTFVLSPLSQRGAHVAAIHPAMTFTGHPEAEAARMTASAFAVTAPDPDALRRAHALVNCLGDTIIDIAEDKRALYHAALSHAANHLVTLQSGAMEILRAAGVEAPGTVLRPLVSAALDNVLTHGFDALSGPLLRGDAQTVARHLEEIALHAPQELAPYRAMARATLQKLGHRRLPAHDAIATLLDESDAKPAS